jgi:hypothetical protein
MEHSNRHTHLPEFERMSMVAAMIFLTFAFTPFIRLKEGELAIQLPGLYLGIPFGAWELVVLVVAPLTVSGTDWLLRTHPHLGADKRIDHWLLPGITSLAIGFPLFQIPVVPAWWLGFALGGVLLIQVLFAEYIVVDRQDLRYLPASAGLTAVAFALYLVLTIAFRFAAYRLLFLLPMLAATVFLISLRILRLRLAGEWALMEAAIIALITVQLAAALHYLPLNPVSFGLILLAPAYALTNFFSNLADDQPVRQALIEPVVILVLIWISALIIR